MMEQVMKIVKRTAQRRSSRQSLNGQDASVPDRDRDPLVVTSAMKKLSFRRKKSGKVKSSFSKGSITSILDEVKEGNLDTITAFLKSTKGLIARRERNISDDLGWGLVHIATEHHHLSMLKLIVEAGQDPNDLAKESCVTPLAIAVCSGDADITSYLLSMRSVREAYGSYTVNFIMSNATDNSVSDDVLNVRLSVQRKVRRHGQQFCKPMLMWEAAVLVGGVLHAAGKADAFRVAYLLQSTKCPGLAILPSYLSILPMQHLRAEYLQLLLDSPQEATGLPKANLCSVLKDLLWYQVHTFSNDLKPCITAAHVKSTTLILFQVKESLPDVYIDIQGLIQQFMEPAHEEEILNSARAVEREAYLKRMVSFKLWMLRTIKANGWDGLHTIAFAEPTATPTVVKLSVSSIAQEMTRPRSSSQPSAADGGLCQSVARVVPIQQISSLDFWKELFNILGPVESCVSGDCSGLVDELQKRRAAFSRSHARGTYSYEECDKMVESLKSIEAFLESELKKEPVSAKRESILQ